MNLIVLRNPKPKMDSPAGKDGGGKSNLGLGLLPTAQSRSDIRPKRFWQYLKKSDRRTCAVKQTQCKWDAWFQILGEKILVVAVW